MTVPNHAASQNAMKEFERQISFRIRFVQSMFHSLFSHKLAKHCSVSEERIADSKNHHAQEAEKYAKVPIMVQAQALNEELQSNADHDPRCPGE
jgi:hypothetical protein